MSLPEVLLWRRLRARGLADLYFRRQHPIGPYVLDFYCDEHRLALEVDGAMHHSEERRAKDEQRDAWFALRKIRTLRLRAAFVLQDMDGALRSIVGFISETPLP